MRKSLLKFIVIAIATFIIIGCDNLWEIHSGTDIAFSLNIDSLEKSRSSLSRNAEGENKITISLRQTSTQEKVAEKTVFYSGDTEDVKITFTNLDIKGKIIFAEAHLSDGDDISIGRSESKKMRNGVNTLNIEDFFSLEETSLVEISAGSFQRDSDGTSPYTPNQTVTLNAFEMGITEVTQKQWLDVMGGWANDKKPTEALGAGEDFPTYYVSWYDAVNYCNKLTELEMGEEHQVYTINEASVTQDLEKKGYRLPTEAEWEYAAGFNSTGERFTYAGTSTAGDVPTFAWYNDTGGKTHEVKGKEHNSIGLYDMNGNVSEWCWDWHHEDGYYGGLQTNPEGYLSGSNKVLRGGSFVSNVDSLHVSWRTYNEPTKQDTATIGFRVVRTK